MQLTPHVGLSAVAALAATAVAAFAWRRRAAASTPLAAFAAGSAVWTAGNALTAASATTGAKLFWVDVQYVGLAVVPVAWFAFACEYTGREEWATRRTLAALAVVPAVTVALAWTNGSHHLVRASSEVVTVDGVATLDRTFGPWFWVALVYSNLLNGAATVLLVRGLDHSRDLYRRQTLAVLAGTTVPWAASVLFYNGASSVEPETFFSVTAIAFGYATVRYDFLDVVPIGRAAVVEELADPVLVLDGDGRVADANPAAARLFDWPSADAAIGRPMADACASRPELVDRYAGSSADGEVAVDLDGERRHFDVRTAPLSEQPGSAPGTALILRDVTPLKRRERRLERQNDRLERVGRTIAHDLRNPLNVAEGNLELARETGDDDRLDAVADAHDRMDDIIEEVLSMARDPDAERRDRLVLGRVAESAWANVETGDADLVLADADVPVAADRGQLTSAFENLFRNAVEHSSTSNRGATRSGDAVEHGSTSNRPSDDDAVEHGPTGNQNLEGTNDAAERAGAAVTIEVGALDDAAGFYVADDGPGIPEGDRERVFERGFTTHPEGTGIGLAVVEEVAERHGWRVGATEAASGGARFEIRGVEVAAAAAE